MTPEERELVLGVRHLARSMARTARPSGTIDADDLEQAALAELCRSLASWPACMPFARFAWYRFRSGIAAEIERARWRRNAAEIAGRLLDHDADPSQLVADEPFAGDEIDGCIICGRPLGDGLTSGRIALYCGLSCRQTLNELRWIAGTAPKPPRRVRPSLRASEIWQRLALDTEKTPSGS